MGRYVGIVALIVFVISVRDIEMVPETLKQLTAGFLKVLDTCKTELGISDNVLTDMYHIWKQEYDNLNRETGCVINCMSKKLELFDANGKFHHGNTKEFALKNGAGEEIASQLVEIVHQCVNKSEEFPDECERALEMSKCLRTAMKTINWSPKMEVIISEVITEV